MEQLTQKKEILQQLNSQIAVALQTGTDLQTDMLESEEIQDTIMECISIVKQRVQSSCLSRCCHLGVYTNSTYKRTSKPLTYAEFANLLRRCTNVAKLSRFIQCGSTQLSVFNKIQKFDYLSAQLHGDASRIIAHKNQL